MLSENVSVALYDLLCIFCSGFDGDSFVAVRLRVQSFAIHSSDSASLHPGV